MQERQSEREKENKEETFQFSECAIFTQFITIVSKRNQCIGTPAREASV